MSWQSWRESCQHGLRAQSSAMAQEALLQKWSTCLMAMPAWSSSHSRMARCMSAEGGQSSYLACHSSLRPKSSCKNPIQSTIYLFVLASTAWMFKTEVQSKVQYLLLGNWVVCLLSCLQGEIVSHLQWWSSHLNAETSHLPVSMKSNHLRKHSRKPIERLLSTGFFRPKPSRLSRKLGSCNPWSLAPCCQLRASCGE